MDRGVQAHNQLRLNLDVPYDVRHLEARLRPPPPVVIERLAGSYAPQPPVSADSGDFDPFLAADSAAGALAALSRDRLAAAQMLARRDLKQQRFVLDAQQRLAGRAAGPAASRPTTPSWSAPRRVPSVAPLASPAAGGGFRLPAATRVVSSMALATGRRTPDRPGSGASGRNSSAKSAPGRRATKGDAATKKRLSSAIAATSAKTAPDAAAYGYDSAAAAVGAKETAVGTASRATADGTNAVALTAEESHTGASQLLALQEHIRTIEGELKHLSSLAGKNSREDDAVQRLSESHRGAIRALQSLAADMPNRKRSDGDTTYRELSAVMKQLSQLCTQLELAGAESARLSQDPRDTAKADVLATGGISGASPAFASPGTAAAALGLKYSRKASASGKRTKGLPMKLPSERLYPRTGSSSRSAATKKSASAGMAAVTTVRRSPYAPKQSPVIVSPYLTKPLPVSLGSINNASRENRGGSDAGQPDSRRGAAYFSVGQTQAGASSAAQPMRSAADADRYADDELRIEDGMLKPANFIERLVEARRRYTDSTAIARGASGHDGTDADIIDPVWLEELTRAAYLEQHQRQQQQQHSKLPTLEEEAVTSKATSRTALTNSASAKASSLRLNAASSAVFDRQLQDEVAAPRLEQQHLQLQQGDGNVVVGSGKEELKDYRGGSSSRKPSAESLNNGLARMLEAKVSSNGDLLADMILSDLVEDTAREMAELEEEDGVSGDQPDAGSRDHLCDQLLARIAVIQTEHDEIRRRWMEKELYMRNTSPTVLDADETAATMPTFTATGTAPQPYVAGNVELSTSSSAATSADAAQCREHEGDEGRVLTFTRRSRATAPRERSSQAAECLDSDKAVADADGNDHHGSHCNHGKAHRARREASAVRLSVPDSMLLSIADNLDEYKRYLARTYQETTSEFDPARFAEECAERIQDDCIEQLAGEVGKAASDIVDKLYKDEFLPLSRGENEAGN